MRIALLARESSASVDAIHDHTVRLADALRGAGADVDLRLRRPDGSWADGTGVTHRRLGDGLDGYDVVLLQYNPFLYGRRGFAPWLPVALWRLRAARSRPRVALLIHETAMPLHSARWALMGLWQRAQLRALRPAADVTFASIDRWAEDLGRLRPKRPTVHLPVGSNLPDMRSAREPRRAALGVDSETLVVATLTTGHPWQLLDLAAAALRRLAEADGRRLVLLALGAGAGEPPGLPPPVEVVRPGPVPADELAASLAAADLFLAPFKDGVSTKRGSLMAALQHGLAIVGTCGESTDASLAASGALVLVPCEPSLFAKAALEVGTDPDRRRALGVAARRLYATEFDWPVLARRILAHVGDTV